MLCLLLVGLVYGDVYLHNPAGSNDRNCERNVNRNNGNLMFDSQNNAKGGYACPRPVASSNAAFPSKGLAPRLAFQEGSKLEIEWTAQHGSGNPSETPGTPSPINVADSQNVHSEIVIQLGCASTLDPAGEYGKMYAGQAEEYLAVPRQGIPNTNNDAATNRAGTADPGVAAGASAGTNLRFGIHETPAWYNAGNRIERNKALFTADQNVNRRSSIGTRQNPNGGRRGLENPEERDYYPLWRESPFLDVAYLVDDKSRCGTGALPCGGASGTRCVGTAGTDWVGNAQGYSPTGTTGESQVSYGTCTMLVDGIQIVPKAAPDRTGVNGAADNAARNAFNGRRWPNNAAECATIGATWTPSMFGTRFAMTAGLADISTVAGKVQTAAALGAECKVIDASRSNHLGNANGDDTASRYTMTIPSLNPATIGARSTPQGEPCFLRVRYNMTSSDYARDLNAAANGDASPIQQDPLVKIGPGGDEFVELALNTNQYGRTFQDRSYVFNIVPQDPLLVGKTIINMGVRGKRGNIVQTYPAVEYDMVPNKLIADPDTAVIFQWTGSDYNPQRGCNDGDGGPYTGGNVAAGLTAATTGSNGNSRTDRMTLLATADPQKNFPATTAGGSMLSGTGELFSAAQAKRFAYADAHAHFAQFAAETNTATLNCLTATELAAVSNNENRRHNHPRNCAKGNSLLPYFAPETLTFTQAQVGSNYKLFSPRNNNFSNRDTKVLMMVRASSNPGGTPTLPTAEFTVPALAVPPPKFEAFTDEEIDLAMEADVPGFDPVENTAYGDGAKEGCTQTMLTFAAAPASVSAFTLMVCTLLTALITSV